MYWLWTLAGVERRRGAVDSYSEQKQKAAEEEVNAAEEALAKARRTGASQEDISQKERVYTEAKAKEESWREGGASKRKLDTVAVTLGAILSGGSAGEVAVTAISPELNAQIHKYTSDNKTANLLAHAALSALEAGISGNNALAGAASGVAGEASAMLLSEVVFNKEASQLSEEERELLSVAGQLSGALVGNAVGGNTATTLQGIETAKRAVENNFLSQSEYSELERLSNKKILTLEEAIRVQYLLEKDKVSDRLLAQWQKEPDSLSQQDREMLFRWVDKYGNVPTQIGLLNTSVDLPQMKPDYSDLKLRARKVYDYSTSFQGRMNHLRLVSQVCLLYMG
ncbi:VENN motif pre-toxin domain-containing protein [Actinobacillus equuli subsp. haemolyticus]|uniref:VENN motif pre-toxin domain-containing protein n=1 Tax=Actinobacillus equuli TaxID=718 RepID=UPI0024426AEE|nr:VENN motif pre-toxin domain-containing protein [Actinobacillus equuli]WGE62393.1 VENN motif pre-toxin domain-containing protein [Actinobacillus equuli subsp. haemolyticus]